MNVIFGIILIVLVSAFFVLLVCGVIFEEESCFIAAIVLATVIVLVCLLGAISDEPTIKRKHYYPAEKYELKYKITEFDEKTDTTYVLIPK